jgi:hypothetical protein
MGQLLRDRDHLVPAERLGSAELDQHRRIGLDRHRRHQRRGVIDAHPPRLVVALPEHRDLARAQVEPPQRREMDLLERIRPYDDPPQSRPLEPPLRRDLGLLDRVTERGVHPGVREIDEPPYAGRLRRVHQRRHPQLVGLMDRRPWYAGQPPRDHRRRRDHCVDALTRVDQARRIRQIPANDLRPQLLEPLAVRLRANQAPHLIALPEQQPDDPPAKLSSPANHQQHLDRHLPPSDEGAPKRRAPQPLGDAC